MAFKLNIERATLKNTKFRKILNTTKQQQLVLMNIPPGDEIGMEKHARSTQFIRIEGKHSKGVAVVNGKRFNLKDGDSITIEAGAMHNIVNTGERDLLLYTVYSPPVHDE